MSLPRRAPDRETRRCPRCQAALVWTPHSAVLSGETAGGTPDPFKDRLRYEAAWVCENARCGYREPVDVS